MYARERWSRHRESLVRTNVPDERIVESRLVFCRQQSVLVTSRYASSGDCPAVALPDILDGALSALGVRTCSLLYLAVMMATAVKTLHYGRSRRRGYPGPCHQPITPRCLQCAEGCTDIHARPIFPRTLSVAVCALPHPATNYSPMVVRCAGRPLFVGFPNNFNASFCLPHAVRVLRCLFICFLLCLSPDASWRKRLLQQHELS